MCLCVLENYNGPKLGFEGNNCRVSAKSTFNTAPAVSESDRWRIMYVVGLSAIRSKSSFREFPYN